MVFDADALGPFLWRSGLLIGLAYLLNATLFKRCPAYRRGALLAVLLLVPIVWLSASVPLEAPSWLVSLESVRAANDEGAPFSIGAELARASWRVNTPGMWASRGAAFGSNRSIGFSTHNALFAIWLAGAAIFFFQYALQAVRMRQLLVAARPVSKGPLLRRFDRIVRSFGASPRLRLLGSPDMAGPAAAGVFFPAVLVPADREGGGADCAEQGLIHEVLHHTRRDPLIRHAAAIVRGLFWFQPLVHLVCRSLSNESERAVDLAVIEASGDREGYIDQLHQTARRAALLPARTVRTATLFGERISLIRRRIEMLVNHNKFRTARRPFVFAGVVSLLLCSGLLFLAIGSCSVPAEEKDAPDVMVGIGGGPGLVIGDDSADSTGEQHDKTVIVCRDEKGLYRLRDGFESVSCVKTAPFDRLTAKLDKEQLKTLDPDRDWTFDRDAQALRLTNPIDLKENMVFAYGRRAVPWVWSTPNMTKRTVAPIAAGTVEVVINGRDGRLGEDFEVDHERGFIRFLKEDDCTPETSYEISYGYYPYPDRPQLIASMGFCRTKSDKAAKGSEASAPAEDSKAKKSELLVLSELYKKVAPEAEPIGLWKTADSNLFVPKRPLVGREFKLMLKERGMQGKGRFLAHKEEFTFDPSAQRIVLSDRVVIDGRKQVLTAWGIPEDNRTYQFPGPIEKGSIRYIYEGDELAEGEGYVVDYARSRVTLEGREFDKVETKKGMVMQSVFRHVITAGEWTIRNYPEEK